MRQVKLLCLALVAVFASVAMATSAFAAEPKNLPTTTKERTFKGNNDEANPQFVGLKSTFTCKESATTGTEEVGKVLGLFHTELKKCTAAGGLVTCTGLGDASGIILSLGTWHLVYDQLTPELLTAMLFLPETTHFTCGPTLIEVKGELLCLDLEATSSKTSHLFHCHQKEALQLEKTYWDHKGNEVKNAELLCSENHGAFSHCAVLALGLVETTESLFADI